MSYGCNWKTGTRYGNDTFCGLLPAPGGLYCPKHKLFAEEARAEEQRKIELRTAMRKAKAEQREAVKDSPLAAVNPAFDESGRRR